MAFVSTSSSATGRVRKGVPAAIELDRPHLGSPLYALFLAAMGRHQESFAEIKRALEIEPTAAQLTMAMADPLLARYYDRAIGRADQGHRVRAQHVLATF